MLISLKKFFSCHVINKKKTKRASRTATEVSTELLIKALQTVSDSNFPFWCFWLAVIDLALVRSLMMTANRCLIGSRLHLSFLPIMKFALTYLRFISCSSGRDPTLINLEMINLFCFFFCFSSFSIENCEAR